MNLRLTRSIKVILAVCVVAFLVQQTIDRFFGGELESWLGLVPAGVVLHFRVWQLITYAFLHADIMHLTLNAMMLVFLGGEIESLWGPRRFLIYYFTCTISAGLLYLVVQGVFGGALGLQTPMVGASGGIYGLLVAYGIIFAERQLLFMMVFPLKAKQFVWLLAGIEFFTTVFSRSSGSALSSVAHLGGMAAGFASLWGQAAWRVAQRRRAEKGLGNLFGAKRSQRPGKRKDHLKLVVDRDRSKGKSSGDPKGPPSGSGDSGSTPTWH